MAKGKSNIDNKIRESFESANPKAPRDMWSGIEEAMVKEGLDEKVKASFETAPLKAPDHVWSNVNQQLTIDRAWTFIHRRLNRISVWLWLRRGALALIPLLLVFYFWPNNQEAPSSFQTDVKPKSIISNEGSSEIPNGETPQEDKTLQSLSEQLENRIGSTKSDEILGKTLPRDPSTVNLGLNSEVKSFSTDVVANESSILDSIFPGSHNSLVNLNLRKWRSSRWRSPQSNLKPIILLSEKHVEKKRLKPALKKWKVGIRLHYDRFGLNNNMQRLARYANSLVAGQSRSGTNYEVFGQFQWSSASTIEWAYTWDETLGQSYNRFGEGQFLSEHLDFRFQVISVLYQHHFNMPGRWIPHLELALGPYYGILKSARFSSPLGSENRSALYRDRFGAIFRLGQSIDAGDMSFSYGLQGQFSINNFHQGRDGLPAEFDLSQTSRLGLYLGVAYKF